ncbi:hypothetical protein [Streptomyces sp. NPDC020917]|uniref:hypothetical protein n=1 Tax=Streptomyces sp. NPDC020917 TaxID=3365102 RepID=UPI003799D756
MRIDTGTGGSDRVEVYRTAAMAGLKYGALAYCIAGPIRYAIFGESMISPSALSTFAVAWLAVASASVYSNREQLKRPRQSGTH